MGPTTPVVAGEIDDREVTLAGHHGQAVVGRQGGIELNGRVQQAAISADHPDGRAKVSGDLVGQEHVVRAGVGAVQEPEGIALVTQSQLGPDLAVDADHVALELGHPERVVHWVRGERRPSREVQLPVGVKHAVLDDQRDDPGDRSLIGEIHFGGASEPQFRRI